MKKIFLFLITMIGLSSTINAQVTIDETNFPDPEFRAYLLTQGYGEDGIITDEEIAEITYMRLNETNITDITGIQLFSSLNILICDHNPLLTSLDLSGFQSLEWIYCYENAQLATLDFSNCQSLTALYCYTNPQLATMTFYGCPALEFFYCYDNGGPTSLELADFPSLEFFICRNNTGLSSLNVSNCPVLQYFSAYNNHLTSLKVTDCSTLSYFYCYNNQLSDQAMLDLVTSLYDRTEAFMGVIYAIDLNSETEGNVCTTTTVGVARAINWFIYGWGSGPYEGSEPPTPTGLNEIDAAKSSNSIRYNLMGQPVGNDYKGIVIENGKKVLVK